MSDYVIAKYLRLSVEDAKTDSMSIENQRLYLDAHIAGMDINAEITEFVDNGYSGTNFERPGVQELLDLIRTGKINCVVVKDFSRFGRDSIETGYFLERVFPLFGIRFISVSDAYDSDENAGDTGGIEVAFKFLINEQYSRDLSRKIKTAKHARAIRGEYIVKNCAFGFKKVGNRLEIDEPAAATVRQIFDMAANGQSLVQITARLYADKRPTPSEYRRSFQQDTEFTYLWNKSQVLSILSDEQYIGTYVAGKSRSAEVGSGKTVRVPESEWIKIPGLHPVIVDSAVFTAARERIDQKGAPLRKRELGTWQRYGSVKSPLRGKVICGCCGHMMKLSSTRNAAFHCEYTRAAPDAPCHRLRISDSELQAKLLDAVRRRVSDMPDVAEATGQRQEYEKQICECEDEKHSLYEKYVIGELDAEAYRTEKASLDSKLEYLNRVCAALAGESAGMRELANGAADENALSRSVVEGLIEKVLAFPDGDTEIVWK